MANATLERKQDGQDRDAVKIIVTKQPGSKGSGVLAVLVAAPHHINPAIAMLRQVQDLPVEALLLKQAEINAAIAQGSEEAAQVEQALKALRNAGAIPAIAVPVGF